LLLENKHSHMTHLTRGVLIKAIVADELANSSGEDYLKSLKSSYHRWEHESSDVLCRKYNEIQNTNITVEILDP